VVCRRLAYHTGASRLRTAVKLVLLFALCSTDGIAGPRVQ